MPHNVNFVYLRRQNKKDKTFHPFAALGLVYHPKSKKIHIAYAGLHSSDKHFSKSQARKLLIRKAYTEAIYLGVYYVNAPELSKIINKNAYSRITDKANTQRIFESVYNDVVEMAKDADIAKDLKALAIHEHGCAP